MTRNGRSSWRLKVGLPPGYQGKSAELFQWVRDFVIPACLNAPFRVTLELVAPESDRLASEDDDLPQ